PAPLPLLRPRQRQWFPSFWCRQHRLAGTSQCMLNQHKEILLSQTMQGSLTVDLANMRTECQFEASSLRSREEKVHVLLQHRQRGSWSVIVFDDHVGLVGNKR